MLTKAHTTQKMKFSIKDFFSKNNLRIWSHLLKKSLMENLIFCAVTIDSNRKNYAMKETKYWWKIEPVSHNIFLYTFQ